MNTIDTLQSTSRAHEYLDLWIQLISEHLGNIIRAKVTAEAAGEENFPGNTQEVSKKGVWICFSVDSAAGQAFFLTSQDADQLVRYLRSRPTTHSNLPAPDRRKALENFFSQIVTKVPMAEWVGFDTELKISYSNGPEWETAVKSSFRFSTAEGSLFLLHAQVSTELASALQSAQETDETGAKTHPAISPHAFRPAPDALRDSRLELLMDVELEVVLRFGQREMLLRDVVNLTPGTVLELDQQVQDPVELLVGNKVIAWGEVVTIDGNYGLRITSLASRKERLESLRK